MDFLTGEPLEYTFALIKPDAVKNGHAGEIISMMECNFLVADVLCMQWEPAEVMDFYKEHRGKPFFSDLVDFMAGGRMYAITLVAPDAVRQWRELMGATDPRKAVPGTIRECFGSKDGPMMMNAVHGSDSIESAGRETRFVQYKIGVVARRGDRAAPAFGDEAKKLIERYKHVRPGE